MNALQDPEKKFSLALIDDYCEKTYRLFQSLIAISPPTPFGDAHAAWVDLIAQYLERLTAIKEYLAKENEMEKILYNRIIINTGTGKI